MVDIYIECKGFHFSGILFSKAGFARAIVLIYPEIRDSITGTLHIFVNIVNSMTVVMAFCGAYAPQTTGKGRPITQVFDTQLSTVAAT